MDAAEAKAAMRAINTGVLAGDIEVKTQGPFWYRFLRGMPASWRTLDDFDEGAQRWLI